ncbi:MAG: hypothetical protein JO168_10495 [Solirubrobacterales bacterium]|nr:hypothetical protein [Solirubrobacterales bacterium]
MRSRLLVLVFIGSLAGGSAFASARPTLQLRQTGVGTILVNSRGYTLYTFSRDSRNRDVCVKLSGCLYVWPALASAHPTAGRGVNRRLIGTITVPGVGKQVTYAGHPLYTYIGDHAAGETRNINIYQSGGYWPAIAASGRSIK